MRPYIARVGRVAALAVVVLSCTPDRITAPAPAAPRSLAAEASAPEAPLVVITELMSDPKKVADGVGEWFEIYNGGSEPVDLQGWSIVSAAGPVESHVIDRSVVVDPGSYAVLGNNDTTSRNGGVVEQYSYGADIVLNNSTTDWLVLRTADGVLVDSVAYSARACGKTTTTWSPLAGASRALQAVGPDHSVIATDADWVYTPTSTTYGLGDRGTPGTGPALTVVRPGPVAALALVPSEANIRAGGSCALAVAATDADGRRVLGYQPASWNSSDEGVVSVDQSGLVTGVAGGTATVTALDGALSATATFSVLPPTGPARISLSSNGDFARVPVGFTESNFATVYDSTEAVISPTPHLTWSSNNTGVAVVDTMGYVTGVGTGTARIYATADNGVTRYITYTVISASTPPVARYGNQTEFGAPTDADPSDDFIVTRPEYTLSYDARRGGPSWVSWELNPTQFGAAPRCDCFTTDPAVPVKGAPVTDYDYRNSGYSRGHMAQSESRTASDLENATTFYFSNILPQAAANNSGPWGRLENYLNNLVRDSAKAVYVVAGGIYAPAAPTLKGQGKVAVPEYTWKVAVIMPAGEGAAAVHGTSDLRVIAVRVPNLLGADAAANPAASSVGIDGQPWQAFTTTVDAIEAQTGYDLLALLPDRVERIVESGDAPPVPSLAVSGDMLEGTALAFDASASTDADGDALTYAWSFGDGATATGMVARHAYADDGSYAVSLTVTDAKGIDSTITTTVRVANVAPVITAIDLASPVAVGAPASLAARFTDAGSADTHTATIDWGDGSTSAGAVAGGAVTASHRYASAGLYTVAVTVRDDDAGATTAAAPTYVAVYDAAAGFVTAGGWYAEPGTGDKSVMTLEARYGRDAAAPSGTLVLHARGERLVLASERMSWLVLTPGVATLSGTGRLAGRSAPVSFLVTVVDGKEAGGADRVRVKLWDASGVIYDNLPGAVDGSTSGVALGGGNVDVKQK